MHCSMGPVSLRISHSGGGGAGPATGSVEVEVSVRLSQRMLVSSHEVTRPGASISRQLIRGSVVPSHHALSLLLHLLNLSPSLLSPCYLSSSLFMSPQCLIHTHYAGSHIHPDTYLPTHTHSIITTRMDTPYRHVCSQVCQRAS